MRKTVALITPLIFLFACNRAVDSSQKPIDLQQLPQALGANLVVVLETDEYLVLSRLESLESSLTYWIRLHEVPEDKALLVAIKEAALTQSTPPGLPLLRADQVAQMESLADRLEFRASDLLEANKCFVYNKASKFIEPKVVKRDISNVGYTGHGFFISQDTLLQVIEKVY